MACASAVGSPKFMVGALRALTINLPFRLFVWYLTIRFIPKYGEGTSKNPNFRPATHVRIRVVVGGEAAQPN